MKWYVLPFIPGSALISIAMSEQLLCSGHICILCGKLDGFSGDGCNGATASLECTDNVTCGYLACSQGHFYPCGR